MSVGLVDADGAERLSEDDLATRREEEFLAAALRHQAEAAERQQASPGLCTNCGEPCLPLAVYCDAGCRADHEARLAIMARKAGRHG